MRKTKSQKSILDNGSPRALRWHCIKTGMILSLNSLHRLRNTFRNHFLWCRAIHNCRLQLYHAQKKAYVNMIQKHHHLLGLIKAHSTWNEAKWETDLWSDEPTWMPLSPQWRREGPSSSFTVFSSKHCMVWRCVSAYEIGIYIKGTSILGSIYRF